MKCFNTEKLWFDHRSYFMQIFRNLKSLGPIDRKFHGQGENDGFVVYEYMIKQCSSFCKYTNISVMEKRSKKIACQQ